MTSNHPSAEARHIPVKSGFPDWAYKDILSELQEGIIIVSVDGSYRHMNKTAAKLYGFRSPKEFTEHLPHLSEIFELSTYPDDRILSYEQWPIAQLQHGMQHVHSELYVKRLDTGKRSLLEFTGKIITSKRSPACIVLTLRDISERKINEEKLIESEARIRTISEISRAKDEFIALASHQLRTPATGVKQYVGMLLQGYSGELDSQQRELLQTAYDSNERQLDVINSLLNVAQLDAGKVSLMRSPCRIDHMLHEIVKEQTEVFHERQQTLTLITPHKPLVVPIDYRLIRMVIENIVDNASKYSLPGKTVTIQLSNERERVSVAITDQGVGISKHDQIKLFQKFSRINNHLSTLANGSGLGLYWAKKVLDLHQADVQVHSQKGHGSTFTIYLNKKLS